ncbi:MAG: hypothetical protein PSY14_11030 [bacterium]|nr:hypothetical protein [bacterium]
MMRAALITAAIAASIFISGAASAACPPQPPLQGVEMVFVNKPPVIINDQSSAALGGYQISTTFARSQNEIFTVGGLHLSELAPQYVVSFEISDGGGGLVCIAPVALRVSIEYAPRVMIASEHAPGSCRYRTILDHEMRHVNTDIIAFNEFLPQVRRALEESARKLAQMGPMQASSIEKAKGMLVDAVREKLVHEIEEFHKIRFVRQQIIDTRQQYLLENKLCKQGE